MSEQDRYWIYILECNNGSYYTGCTKDLAARYRQHLTGNGGARFTRANRPVGIAQCWRVSGAIGTALKIECLIKSMSRKAKEGLVQEPQGLKKIVANRLALDLDISADALSESERKAIEVAAGS